MCKGAAVPRLRGTRLDAGAGSHGDDSFGLAAASTWIPYVDPRSRPPALTYYPPPSITPLARTSFSLPPSRPDQPPAFPSLSRPLCSPFHPPRRLLPAVSSYVFSLSMFLSFLFVRRLVFFHRPLNPEVCSARFWTVLLLEFFDWDLGGEEKVGTKILRDSIMDGWM